MLPLLNTTSCKNKDIDPDGHKLFWADTTSGEKENKHKNTVATEFCLKTIRIFKFIPVPGFYDISSKLYTAQKRKENKRRWNKQIEHIQKEMLLQLLLLLLPQLMMLLMFTEP